VVAPTGKLVWSAFPSALAVLPSKSHTTDVFLFPHGFQDLVAATLGLVPDPLWSLRIWWVYCDRRIACFGPKIGIVVVGYTIDGIREAKRVGPIRSSGLE